MGKPVNQDPRDRRIDDAYRDASRETPPAELDARILAEAHRAVHARPQDAAQGAGWTTRHRVPLSLAATVVIAVTVALMVEDDSRRAPEPDAPLAAPRSDAPWGSRAAPPAAPSGVPREAPRPAESAPAPAAAARDDAPRRPAPPDEPSGRDRRESANDGTLRAPRAAGAPLSSGSAAPAPAEASLQARPPAAAASALPAHGAEAGERAVDSRERSVESRERSVDVRERSAQERPPRTSRDEAMAEGRRANASTAPARTPEAWLDDIRRLRAEGRTADAEAALGAFRRTYPDYALPADLRTP
jgi:hypothetical protein